MNVRKKRYRSKHSKTIKFFILLLGLSLCLILVSCGQQKITIEPTTITPSQEITDETLVARMLPEVQSLSIDMSSSYTDLNGALIYSVAGNTDATVATVNLNLVSKTLDLEFLKIGSTVITFEERYADNSLRGTTRLQIDITLPATVESSELDTQAVANNHLADVNIKVLQNFNDDAVVKYGNLSNSNSDVLDATIVNEDQLNLEFKGISGSTTLNFRDLNDPTSPTAIVNIVVVAPPPVADLEVTKTDPVDPIELSREMALAFPYNITVKNIGEAAAENVTLTDVFESPGQVSVQGPLPEGCTTQDPITMPLTVTAVPNTFSHTITCELGTLDPDEMVMLEFSYLPVAEGRGVAVEPTESEPTESEAIVLENTATVATTSLETNLENNEAVETTTIEPFVPVLTTFKIKKVIRLVEGAEGSLPDPLPSFAVQYTCQNFGGQAVINGAELSDGEETVTIGQTIYEGEAADFCANLSESNLPDGWELTSTDVVAIDEEIVATLTNTYTPPVVDPEPLGSITIRKSVDNNSFADQLFDFTFDGSPFQVSENSDAYVVNDLPAGTYTVLENVPANWDLLAISCGPNNNTGATGGINAAGINIVLEAGENEDCTFINSYVEPEPVTGSIMVNLQSDPSDGTDFEFTLSGASTSDLNQTLDDDTDAGRADNFTRANLDTGSYTITEVLPENWTLTDVDCGAASVTSLANGVTIDLMQGENVICNFTNTFDEPENESVAIRAVKYNDLNQDGNRDEVSFTSLSGNVLTDWTFRLYDSEGNELASGQTAQVDDGDSDLSTYVEFGGLSQDESYTVCLVPMSGWFFTDPPTRDATYDLPCKSFIGSAINANSFGFLYFGSYQAGF